MSRAFGPKGVRACLSAGFQLPASGPAPPRWTGRCRRLEPAGITSLLLRTAACGRWRRDTV